MDQRHRQRQALAQAERQRVRQRIHHRSEVEPLHHLGDAGGNVLRRQPEQAGVQVEILRHRQLGIEREGLRHVADALAHAHVARIDLRTEQPARPSLAASSPVSIFIVVDLPQPFEPRKPKISPRWIRKLTRSTATKSSKRIVSPSASMAISAWVSASRGAMTTAWWSLRRSSGSKAMKASSSVAAPVCARRSAGAPVARTSLHPSPPASRTAPPPPYRPSRRRRSCRAGRRGSRRSAPRTAAATADRRRWSARRGSADPDRG
jgi:hypothetical protein